MEQSIKFYVGIDVSKPYFDASIMKVVNHQKSDVQTEQFANNKEGLLLFKKWCKATGVKALNQLFVVIENTGVYHWPIWKFCSNQDIALHIGNAAHIKWSLGITRGKNDKIDSIRLCNYAFKNQDELQATAALNPVFIQLKDLMTARTKLLCQYTSTKSYLKELRPSNDKTTQIIMEQAHKAALEGIKKSIETIEAAINKIIATDATIKKNYELIKTIPGIGHLTTIYIICCTNNFAGKISGKQLASYAGVVPFEHSSGISIKGKNRVHKMANKDLKKLLHLCALATIKYDKEMKHYYDRKKAEGKNGMLVLNAIRNKLIIRVAAVVNKQTPFVSNYKHAC
ncbi:MAG: IS110 family transposase [Chitinophagaceae bacterium]